MPGMCALNLAHWNLALHIARRPAKFFPMNHRFYDAFINSQSNQISQLNFIHGIINEMSQNHQFDLERSWFFVRSINFVALVLFQASVVHMNVWRSFSCSWKMFVDFVERGLNRKTVFICLSSQVAVGDAHCFFWTCTLADLSIRSCVFQIWRNFDSLRKFSTKISQSCESFGRLHFCHLGTSLLVLLKW